VPLGAKEKGAQRILDSEGKDLQRQRKHPTHSVLYDRIADVEKWDPTRSQLKDLQKIEW
jgi:hypothetical protein